MKRKLLRLLKSAFAVAGLLLSVRTVSAQAINATVKLNKDILYQKISGFGGFVNSPQFGYIYVDNRPVVVKMDTRKVVYVR